VSWDSGQTPASVGSRQPAEAPPSNSDRHAEFIAGLKDKKAKEEAADASERERRLHGLSPDEREATLAEEQAEREREERAEMLRKKNLAGYTSAASKAARRGRGRGRGKR
jgi:hypothetical protein